MYCVFFFKQKTAYDVRRSLVGSEMCIRDRTRWMDEQEMIVSGSQDVSSDTRKWRFAYHLSPLRVRWGSNFGVFADLGFGYKGVANAGISVRF